jgi:hypothetical protein
MPQGCHPERSERPLSSNFQATTGVLPSRSSGPASPPQDDYVSGLPIACIGRHEKPKGKGVQKWARMLGRAAINFCPLTFAIGFSLAAKSPIG